jgi:cytochrome c
MLSLSAGPAYAAGDGDAAKGKKQYNRCKSCHSVKEGKKKIGPSLFAIVDRAAASSSGYKYSSGLKAAAKKGLKWDEANLFKYLKNPTAFLKEYLGTKSVKNKMKNKYRKESLRHNIIAYLKTVK